MASRSQLQSTQLGETLEDIRGVGLLIGLSFALDASARDIARAAFEEGLLVVPASGNVVRLIPPLDAPEDDLREAVQRLSRAIERVRR